MVHACAGVAGTSTEGGETTRGAESALDAVRDLHRAGAGPLDPSCTCVRALSWYRRSTGEEGQGEAASAPASALASAEQLVSLQVDVSASVAATSMLLAMVAVTTSEQSAPAGAVRVSSATR